MNSSPDRPLAIGIDIGGTNTKAAIIDGRGQIVLQRRHATQDDRDALVTLVRELLAELGDTGGGPVGIASPGLAARDMRSIGWMRGRMSCLEGLDWSQALQRPVWVLNDAHAATLAEAWCGGAAGARHVLMLTLGTGVGGGVIVDGHLLHGAIGRAGHVGHICLDASGPPDIVGTPGSLEDLVGDHSVKTRTGGRFSSTDELTAAAARGDTAAVDSLRQMVHILACGLVSLINVLDPEKIVIGGGIARAGKILFEPLQAELDRLEWRPLGKGVTVVPAQLGDVAGAIGAARFAELQEHQKERATR